MGGWSLGLIWEDLHGRHLGQLPSKGARNVPEVSYASYASYASGGQLVRLGDLVILALCCSGQQKAVSGLHQRFPERWELGWKDQAENPKDGTVGGFR